MQFHAGTPARSPGHGIKYRYSYVQTKRFYPQRVKITSLCLFESTLYRIYQAYIPIQTASFSFHCPPLLLQNTLRNKNVAHILSASGTSICHCCSPHFNFNFVCNCHRSRIEDCRHGIRQEISHHVCGSHKFEY